VLGLFATTLTFLGLSAVSEKDLRDAIGAAPDEPAAYSTWIVGAKDIMLDELAQRGYVKARIWHRGHGDHITFEVDEGHMHRVSFDGASVVQKGVLAGGLLLSEDVGKVRGLLHEPTLETMLARIQEQPGVLATNWHVEDGDRMVTNALGDEYAERILYIDLVNRETPGPGFSFDLPAIYGIFVGLEADAGNRFEGGPWLYSAITYAPPLVSQFFDDERGPIRWNYGRINLEYGGRDTFKQGVSPLIIAEHTLANNPRSDVDLDHVITSDFFGVIGLDFHNKHGWQVGAMTQRVDVTRFEASEGTNPVHPPGVWRIGAYGRAHLVWEDMKLRQDLHDYLNVEVRAAVNELGQPNMSIESDYQAVRDIGSRDHMVLRGHGLYAFGDTRFFDAKQLAGRYQKVYFRREAWVREAASIDLAYRKGVHQNWSIGAWHDMSAFLYHCDDSNDGNACLAPEGSLSMMDGFGPSVHWVALDQFAVDVYYGAGFSLYGFGHNVRIDFKTIY